MSKNSNLKIWLIIIAIIVGVVVGTLVFWKSAGQNNQNKEINNNLGNTVNTMNENQTQKTTLPDGLQITDEVIGTGAEALAGNTVTVNYIGTLTDGKKFDSSYDRGQPFSFILGAGQVIRGWDEGILGMKVGGKRKLVIPASLGYGSQSMGNGLIPANSTLIFEVELLGVQG